MKWISVEDHLPKEDIDVWGYQEDGFQVRARVNEGDWFQHSCLGEFELTNRDITHWMPLPDPPADLL